MESPTSLRPVPTDLIEPLETENVQNLSRRVVSSRVEFCRRCVY